MTPASDTETTTDADAIWRRTDDLAEVRHEDRTVVLDLRHTHREDGPTPYVLSGSAHLIWSALEGPATVAQIARTVAEQTGTDAADLVTPVVAFLDELETTGLVRSTSPSSRRAVDGSAP